MTNYQKALIRIKGWRDGAGGKPMSVEISSDDTIEYSAGYMLGKIDARKASDEIADELRVTFNEIKPA